MNTNNFENGTNGTNGNFNFEQHIENLCDSFVDTTSKFNNLREIRGDAEPVFYTTFSLYFSKEADEYGNKKMYYEFNTSDLHSLQKNYNNKLKKKDLNLVKYVAFYKSNNPVNTKLVANYYILLYRLNSEINLINKKIEYVQF